MLTLMLEDAFWSAIAAVGFAVLFNVPHRALLWCALIGAVGHALRTFLIQQFSMDIIPSTLFACVAVGFLAQWCARRMHLPALIYQVTGAIPMVPGVFAFQTMLGVLALAGIQSASIVEPLSHFVTNGVKTGLILGAIAFGTIAPTLIFHRHKPVV